MFTLRPYQLEMKRGIYREIKAKHRRILACSATGTGKTELAGAIIADLLSRQGWSLFVVDRLELCEQTATRFLDRYGFPSAVAQGNHPLTDPTAPIQVGTWQTLTRRREWLLSWIARAPGVVLIWWDEAHEGMWTAFADWLLEQTAGNPKVIHVGLTATPERTKRTEGMADVCDAIVAGILPGEAMEASPPYLKLDRYVDVPLEGVDLDAIKIKMGDYDEDALAVAMSQPATIATAVNAYLTHAAGRVCIAYAVNVRHAQRPQPQPTPAAGVGSAGAVDAQDGLSEVKTGAWAGSTASVSPVAGATWRWAPGLSLNRAAAGHSGACHPATTPCSEAIIAVHTPLTCIRPTTISKTPPACITRRAWRRAKAKTRNARWTPRAASRNGMPRPRL